MSTAGPALALVDKMVTRERQRQAALRDNPKSLRTRPNDPYMRATVALLSDRWTGDPAPVWDYLTVVAAEWKPETNPR